MEDSRPPIVEVKNEIVQITLNRPDRGNSLNAPLINELHKNVLKHAENANIKAICFLGAGKHFCTGGDLEYMKQATNGASFAPYADFLNTLSKVPTVTACFVQGHCVGGAMGLISACDFVLATDQSKFGLPELGHRLFPFLISPALVKRLGYHRAIGLTLSSKFLSPLEALQIGLVSETVASQSFEERQEQLMQLWSRTQGSLLREGKATMKLGNPTSLELGNQLFESLSTLRKTL